MGCLVGHPKVTERTQNMLTITVETIILCSRYSEGAVQTAHGALRSANRTIPVVHFLLCSTTFRCNFEAAGDTSRLRLRPAKLRWKNRW